MPNTTIGLGIIGLSAHGGWAGRAHVPAIRSIRGYDIRALATSRDETAAEAAKAYGVPLHFGDPAALAAHPDVDLVVVAVRVPHHRELVAAALDAGKMVYCEWPLGNGREEAEAMTERARARGVHAFVGLQGHASPSIRYIRDLVRSDAVGEVVSTSFVASAGAWGDTIEPRLVYGLDRRNGVSMLTVQFGHAIDGLCWCLGEFSTLTATLATRFPTVRRTDTGEALPKTIDDQIAVTGLLESGAVASVHYRSGHSQVANFFWEINGTRGDLIVTGESGRLQYGDFQIRGAIDGKALEDMPVPERYRLVAGVSPADVSYTLAHAYTLMNRDIRDGTGHTPTFADGLRRHRMIEAIERAARSGDRQSYG